MTYAEGLYRRRHKKEVESTEDYLNRVTKAYNEIDKLIGKLSTSKDYIRACNEISGFAQIVGNEYSCAVKPHVRSDGNRQSGTRKPLSASLLA